MHLSVCVLIIMMPMTSWISLASLWSTRCKQHDDENISETQDHRKQILLADGANQINSRRDFLAQITFWKRFEGLRKKCNDILFQRPFRLMVMSSEDGEKQRNSRVH